MGSRQPLGCEPNGNVSRWPSATTHGVDHLDLACDHERRVGSGHRLSPPVLDDRFDWPVPSAADGPIPGNR